MDDTTRMLELLNESFPDLTQFAPAQARQLADARIRPAANIDDVASAEDYSIRSDPRAITVRVYRPHEIRSGAPTTIYAHGGGFLHGSIEGHDAFCRRFSKATGSVVVSVEYPLATEAAPPAARDAVVAATNWACKHGIAPHGVILAGDSSGANLAAGASIVLRDRGESPVIGQVLIYPFLDPTMSSESHRTRATGYFVTHNLLEYYWRAVFGDESPRIHETITPLGVEDLSDLPPAIIVTAGLDPLSDEGALYAQSLKNAGVRVVRRHYPDQFHGFLTIPGYGPGISACDVLFSDIRAMTTTDSPTSISSKDQR